MLGARKDIAFTPRADQYTLAMEVNARRGREHWKRQSMTKTRMRRQSIGRSDVEGPRPTVMLHQSGPAFHYCLYVPPAVGNGTKVDLLVAVHGTGRTSFLEFRDGFSASAAGTIAQCCADLPRRRLGDERRGYKYMPR